jgi:hypothetical protein
MHATWLSPIDVVKDIIRDLEHNVGDLMGYVTKDGPRTD